jgi:glycosyltransferase involved in cell wall biosynthesis
MSTSNPLPPINVLIANYNYEDWVVGCVNSALKQTYPNLAITLVDSNSTDNSWQNIYKAFFKGKMHEKILPHEYEIKKVMLRSQYGHDVPFTAIKIDAKRGPSFARNIGIDYTIKNTWAYAILDADDEMMPNKVERLFKEIAQLPNVIGAAYGDYDVLNVETGIATREYKEPFSAQRLQSNCIVHSGSLVTAEALNAVKDHNGYYDNNLMVAEDWDLWLRICKKYMILHVPEPLTLVRTSRKNTTHSVDKEIWNKCWQRVADKQAGLVI